MKIFCILSVLILLMTGCDLINLDTESGTDYGKLTVYVTDAPFPIDIIEEANITITRIDIQDESDTSEDAFLTIYEDSFSCNLLELRNGVTANLLEVEIPVGNYNTVRIFVGESSILLNDQRTFDLKVPSGEQSGIKVKIEPGITVVTELSSEILLDFDVSKSFVLLGNTNKADKITGFNFKPVMRAVNYTMAGTIAGTVIYQDTMLLENIEVWLEADSIITSAFTNVEGIYGMLGIPAGTYSMYATGDGYDTAVHEVVEVIEGNRMIKNFTLTSIQ